MCEKETLEIKSLKWQIGFRRFINPIITLIVAIGGAYWGFYLPRQEEIKNEKYKQLIEHLKSEYTELKIDAITQLNEYGDRAHLPLRMALRTTKNERIKALILQHLPENLGIEDKVEEIQFKEEIGAINEKQEWIYVGNYFYNIKSWVDQMRLLGYNTSLDYNLIKKISPEELVEKTFSVGVNINTRSSFPDRQFAPKIGVLKEGALVRIKGIKRVQHPNINVKRIWAQVERL